MFSLAPSIHRAEILRIAMKGLYEKLQTLTQNWNICLEVRALPFTGYEVQDAVTVVCPFVIARLCFELVVKLIRAGNMLRLARAEVS